MSEPIPSPPNQPAPGPGGTMVVRLPAEEQIGASIGHYKLLEQIGEGGFGVVYVAEQKEPFRRRVALKIIKLGMDTKQVVARFEAERQALAMMDHPNIAKVFDAGTTSTGRPFFVMELVRGIKITEYCDQNKVPTRDRLDLFIQVCHAIQHAHQKGIIHRDIKPANVLVSLHGGVPVPKVIDFGIAKATQGELSDKTVYTQLQQFMGTPAYMSPEQAEMSGLDVDTRSDIYSLGVLLYELLTGKTPFDSKELVEAGVEGMRRIIREKEPLRPSTRISQFNHEEQTALARRCHSEPPKLISLIRGDLDWVVMKALEKDRTRRYETTNGLAMDIERHLGNEPVLARSPSKVYKFQKTVRRHKLAFAMAVAVMVALLLGIVGSTWQALRARRAERIANEQRERAEMEARRADANALAERKQRETAEKSARKAEAVLSFIREVLTGVGTSFNNREIAMPMLNWASAQTILLSMQKEPDVLAAIQYTLGYCYSKLGQWDQARLNLEAARKTQVEVFGYENVETLTTLRELASVFLSQDKQTEAESLCRQILSSVRTARTNTSGKPPGVQFLSTVESIGFRQLELWAQRKMAQICLEKRDFVQADSFLQELLVAVKSRELTGVEAGFVWEGLGDVALEKGMPEDALKLYESADPYFPATALVQRAWLQGTRGEAYLALHDYSRAEPLLTDSLPTLQKRFGDAHFRVQRAYTVLARLYSETGRPDQAAVYQQKIKK